MWENEDIDPVLLKAAGGSSKDIFEAMVAALKDKLTRAEVMFEGYTSPVE